MILIYCLSRKVSINLDVIRLSEIVKRVITKEKEDVKIYYGNGDYHF